MRSIHRLCAAGMLAFAVGAPLAAADEARLTAAPLPAPQLTVGPGSEKADIDRTLGQLETGIKLTFKRGSSAGEIITVAGTEISLYDADLDGTYALGKDGYQVGKSLVFAPLTPHLSTGRKIYKVDAIEADGSKLTATAVDGGSDLTVTTTGGPVQIFAAFASKDLAFVTTGAKDVVKVLPGSYALAYGIAVAGPKPVGVVRPGTLPPVAVSDKGAIAIGGPYHLGFEITTSSDGKKATIPPAFKLYGKNGEEYAGFKINGCPQVWTMDGAKQKSLGQFEYG